MATEARIEEITAENASIKEFIASRDATIVKEACSGLGTNNKQLIEVLCCRTKTQLERIDQSYRAQYEKTLWEKVKGDVGGNYKKILRYALMERDEFVSNIIDEACSGFGTDESLLIDVLAPLSNEEIDAAKTHWEAKNDESLVDKLNSETSGGLRDLIVSLVTGKRTESDEADEELAEEQATQLYDAGVGKRMGTNDDVFIDIIGKSPSIQLQAVRAKYEETQGMSLHKAVGKEFRGHLKEALQSMLEPPVDFYCAKLKKATKRMGTDEVAICRILGGNDRRQLAAISDRFVEKYDMTLSDLAKAELGGHFKEAVLSWIDPVADPTRGLEQQLAEPLPDTEELLEERLSLLETENEHMKQYIAKVDAQQVRQACKGLGTNESRIVSILCTRTKSQVERIDQEFREMYEMTLKEQLEKDMSGDLKTFMVYTQMETQEFNALQMRKAMQGIGTDEDIMIMILTTRSNDDIAAAQTYYEGRFDESLVDTITSEMSGSFRDLLLTLLRGERDESAEADPEAAEAQAEALHDSDDAKATFAETLSKSSRAQVACISEAYENKYGRSLVKAVVKTFYGKMEDALLSLLFDPIENFARGLKKAFHGMGTDKDAVCRILGGNDKVTCRAIAERFEEKYDQSLVDALKDELRGTFEKAAIAWVSAIDPAAGKEGFSIAAEACVEEDEQEEEDEDAELDDFRKGLEDGDEQEEGQEDGGEGGEEEDDEEELEEAAKQIALENDEGDDEGEEEEDEDEETREARKEARREATAANARRIRARLAKAKKEAKANKARKQAAEKRKLFARRANNVTRKSLEQVSFATERYGSEVIEGLTVWGKWDSELYVKHNEDVQGEHGWQHFRKHGFMNGRLVRIDNAFGAFVGAVDMCAYVDRHEVDTGAVGKRPPFEKALVGFKHYMKEGSDEALQIAITKVVPVYLLGTFDSYRYGHMHKDVQRQMGKARPGRFDEQGYRKLHPEVEDEDIEPFEHFRRNKHNEICVRGRVGKPDRRWYMATYQKPFKHFFKRGYKKGLHIKIRSKPITPLGHYCGKGFTEGRRLWMLTPVGAFDGVLDADAFLNVNPAAGDSGMEPMEYLEQDGVAAEARLPLTGTKMRRTVATCIDGDDAVGGDGDDGAGFDDSDSDGGGDDDDYDDDDNDDDDDDGDDEEGEDGSGDEDDEE